MESMKAALQGIIDKLTMMKLELPMEEEAKKPMMEIVVEKEEEEVE